VHEDAQASRHLRLNYERAPQTDLRIRKKRSRGSSAVPKGARARVTLGATTNQSRLVLAGRLGRRTIAPAPMHTNRVENLPPSADGSDRSLHLASCESGAAVIRGTLHLLGRDDVVIGMRDTLAEGPLNDIDEGGASRVEWWRRIRGKPLDEADGRACGDSDLWAQVLAATDKVMLWHGPAPKERLFALRACWHLRCSPERVHEIALPASGRQWRGIARPVFFDAVALLEADEAASVWERRAKVIDVAARAKEWEALRARPGDWIRCLEGESIVHRPITTFDDELVQACTSTEWTRSRRVIGTVMADHPVSDTLLCWRVRELLGSGTFEGRGADDGIGLPEELRAAAQRASSR
jgi:hypothetical protein